MGERENFITYLELNGLGKSIENYLKEFDKVHRLINEGVPFEKVLALYIKKNQKKPNFRRTSFLNHYIRGFLKDKDFPLPKFSGSTPSKIKKVLSVDEENKVRNELYSQSDRNGLMFDISIVCALRRGELIGLKRKDFYWDEWINGDWKNNYLTLKLDYKTTKRQKERIIKIPPKFAKKIHSYLFNNKILKDEKLFKIKPDTWNYILSKASKKTIDRSINPHLLRFTRANRLDMKKANIQDIQNILGHSDLSTTQRYTQRDKEVSADNVAKILQLDGY